MTGRAEGAVSGEREKMQEQADRRANYVRLAFATYWEARKHHDIGDSMSMAVEAIRPIIEADAIAALAQPQLRDAPDGFVLVPINPTDAMLEAALFTAPRESGVAVDGDISEEDAAWINKECKAAHAETYFAMLAAAPSPSEPKLRDAPEGWRPIESAPKDGTNILVCSEGEGDDHEIVHWHNGWSNSDWTYDADHFTHWQPLPPPPPSPSEPKESVDE